MAESKANKIGKKILRDSDTARQVMREILKKSAKEIESNNFEIKVGDKTYQVRQLG